MPATTEIRTRALDYLPQTIAAFTKFSQWILLEVLKRSASHQVIETALGIFRSDVAEMLDQQAEFESPETLREMVFAAAGVEVFVEALCHNHEYVGDLWYGPYRELHTDSLETLLETTLQLSDHTGSKRDDLATFLAGILNAAWNTNKSVDGPGGREVDALAGFHGPEPSN